MKFGKSLVHPELREALDKLDDSFIKPDNIEESRQSTGGMAKFVQFDTVEITNKYVPGLNGDPDVPIVIFSPVKKTQEQLLPGLLYIHGGGYCCGSAMEMSCQKYADKIDCVVVSVEYRRAPENIFPAALHDCYAALKWFYENAGQMGVNKSRIGIVGASAGGGLTATLALYARDQNGPPVCVHAPLCPMLDNRSITESAKLYTDARVWDRDKNVNGWSAYLGNSEGEPSQYAAAWFAADLSGLPPMYTYVGELDPLRDETIAYAARVAKAGVPVELHVYQGCYHGCGLFAPDAPISKRIELVTMEALRTALWN